MVVKLQFALTEMYHVLFQVTVICLSFLSFCIMAPYNKHPAETKI